MWIVLEGAEARKQLRLAPIEIREKYTAWVTHMQDGGPEVIRGLRGLRDEALSGRWDGCRSSRLNRQWRVVYRIDRDNVEVIVIRVTPHDYRR